MVRIITERKGWILGFGFYIAILILMGVISRTPGSVSEMVLITLMTSVLIEIVQFILSCGYSEVEDVIMNVAGGVIGYLIIKVFEKRKK